MLLSTTQPIPRNTAGPGAYGLYLLYCITWLVLRVNCACDWTNYVEQFDFVTLTETFVENSFGTCLM